MSGEIKLRPDEARAHAQDVRDSKADAYEILNSLRTRMNNLTDDFTGKTQDAFITKLDECKTSLDDLLESLDGLGQFLGTAADTIEQLDTDLASQLG